MAKTKTSPEHSTSIAEKVLSPRVPEWDVKLLNLYEQGAADCEIRKEFRLSYSVWDRLLKQDDRFRSLVELGRDFSEAWWMAKGRTSIDKGSREFNAQLYAIIMRNRFNWDSKEKEKDTTITVSREEIEKTVERFIKDKNINGRT